MENHPKVSICIAVFNGANYLKEAIDSALAQTYDNCEVIVVNDGSDDEGSTEKIALSYGNKIRYFKKENGGVASAMNLAIEKMHGEYFAWLSHDDIYYPDKIKWQVEALENDGDWMAPVFGDYDCLDMYQNTLNPYYVSKLYDMEKVTNGIYPVIMGLVNTVTVMVHKSHFDRVGKFNEELLTTQDYDLWFRIFRSQRLIYIERPLIKWRCHSEQGVAVIPEHMANCEKLHMGFMKSVTKEEILKLFGSTFLFYYEMYIFYSRNKISGCADYVFQYLKKEIFKENCNLERILKRRIFVNANIKYIALYGAGEWGIWISRELVDRDVKIDCFIDRDKGKIGKKIEKIECKDIEKIDDKTTLIVLSLADYEIVKEELQRKGFEYIIEYSKIRSLVLLQLWK